VLLACAGSAPAKSAAPSTGTSNSFRTRLAPRVLAVLLIISTSLSAPHAAFPADTSLTVESVLAFVGTRVRGAQ